MPRRENITNPLPKGDNLTKAHCRERGLAMTHVSMHMERDFRLAMTHESMHALKVRIQNLDRKLSLYQIAKLAELMPYCMLTREG